MRIRIPLYLPAIDGEILDDAIDWHTVIWNTVILFTKHPFSRKTYSAIKTLWAKLRCSHAEVWIPDDGAFDGAEPKDYVLGTCYTSTLRKPYNGVCSRSASSILKHPDRWNYFEIDIQDCWYNQFIASMDEKVLKNQGYDKWTIASYFWYKRLGSPSKYICSEFVHDSILPFVNDNGRLWRNLVYTNSSRIMRCPSPIRLAHALHRSGLDLYSLETGNVILKGQDR